MLRSLLDTGVNMRISGLQKLTLLDYPGHIACTVFTGGCNFRCSFCHNAGLVLPDKMEADGLSEEYVLDFLGKRRGVLDGVAVTGGEPLLHGDMPRFLRKIKDMGYLVKLDTNGSNPQLLKALCAEGLVDRVAMDIKNSPESYPETVGCRVDMAAIEESKNLLLSGVIDYEFRTTVVKGIHTEESLIEAAKWIAGAKEYYLQQFKDSGNLIKPDELTAFDEKEMHALADAVRKYVPAVEVRGV
mgnify:CR=1 FL=1